MKTVYIGLSGGVDSSVAAALLQEDGYNVVGVYMKNWSQDLPGMRCPWLDDLQDAKRVAVKLGIQFKVYDFETEYRQKVVDYMVKEYKSGRTPNPDIMCNQEVKFKLFLQTALSEGADFIATGHYARTTHGRLYNAKNKDKDQTYFLYRVTSDALQKTLFPLGNFTTKKQVRSEAVKRSLATAAKKDSQGICFVGQVGIKDFLGQYITTTSGEVIDENGKVIGRHDGAVFYTIGQRHGLDIGGGLPYYVVDKDMIKNEVYVTTNIDDNRLWRKNITLSDTHWIKDVPSTAKTYTIRLRYRAPLINCKVVLKDKEANIELEEAVRAITPGQSAVVYDKEECIGGGVITGRF